MLHVLENIAVTGIDFCCCGMTIWQSLKFD